MKSMLNSIYLLSMLTFISQIGCTKKDNNSSKNNNEIERSHKNREVSSAPDKPELSIDQSFSYWFIVNGCSTKKQIFSSKEALCKGLQNVELNNNCALVLRKKEFVRVGCMGDFQDMIKNGESVEKGFSPIRCTGYVSGTNGKKIIDQIIPWDRQQPQRIILSDYKEVKDAGQYIVDLIPYSDSPTGAIAISGIFIDNNKLQVVRGRLDSGVSFLHHDTHLNNRNVEIQCGLTKNDLPAPLYSSEGKLDMQCFGTQKTDQDKATNIFAVFSWDQKSRISVPLQTDMNDKTFTLSDISLIMEVNKKTNRPSIKIQATNMNKHINFIGENQGRRELDFEFISAWDDRNFKLYCAPTMTWIKEGANK